MRIVSKPWGQEEIWAETGGYLGKILTINPGHRLSRQYHNFKEETFRVLSGVLTLEIGNVTGLDPENDMLIYNLEAGESFHCPPKMIHRMVCNPFSNLEAVQVLEVSTNPPGIVEDIVRLEDDYKR